ncbi:hypothetical protein AgCh_006781 [Apium graveolens]
MGKWRLRVKRIQEMGYVYVISFPAILFILIVAIACYLLGRARGRQEAATLPQYHGPPVPAPPSTILHSHEPAPGDTK